jgi:hypothetical protein
MPMTLYEEKRRFYAALGEAITEWASVEDHLFMVLQNCLHPADHTVVAATFYAIQNFRSKLTAVDGAVAISLAGSPHLSTWGKVREAVEKRVRRRNELAQH